MSAWSPSTDFLEAGGVEGLCPGGGGFDYGTELRLEHLRVVAQARGPLGNECLSVGPKRAGVSSAWLWSAEWLTEAEPKPKNASSSLLRPPGEGTGAEATSQRTEPLGWPRPSGTLGPRRGGLPAVKEMRG